MCQNEENALQFNGFFQDLADAQCFIYKKTKFNLKYPKTDTSCLGTNTFLVDENVFFEIPQ